MVDVFVSYASQDRERVRPIVDALEATGWTIWWDRRIDAGSAYDREIEKAIDTATCVVVVWSADSIESEWVRTEASEGLERNVLVPVSIEAVRPPLAFRRIQTIDLKDGGNEQELVDAVARHVAIPAGSESAQTPYVGRDEELAVLKSRLNQVERGEGDFVMLSGEAGVGKTRLTQEFAAVADRSGHLVLTGHCLDMDGAPPYQPLIEQIEQALRLFDASVMRQTLGENAPEMAKLMPELRQRFDDIPETIELPPEQERRYLLHGVSEFIHRGALGQPIVLVFEDLHWADDSTCVLLRYLADRLRESRVLILGTYRDTELDSAHPFMRMLQELNRERLIDEMRLVSLDRNGVEQLLARKAKQSPPAELVELVFSETGGNPFFAEELYRHLQESGKMFTENGEFAAGIEIADTEVPRGVRMILGERLERVSDACRKALTTAAVIGRTFGFEVLLSASGKLDEDDLLDALDEAIDTHLIDDLSRDREARYGFAHEQVRQTLLSTLSLPRRQRLHLRVAGALEENAGDTERRLAGEIAHHLYQAGAAADIDKTIHYLLQAAEHALAAIAYEDALRHFDTALEILAPGELEQAARIDSRRARTMMGLERFDEALDVLKASIDSLADSDLRDQLILQRCRLQLDIWRGSDAIVDLEELLQRRRQANDRDSELEVRVWLSRAYYVMSLDREDYADKTIDAYADTIALARELNNKAALCQALVATSQLVDYQPSFLSQARANLDEAEALAAEIGSEDLEIEVATARLNIYLSKSEDELGEQLLIKLEKRRDPIRLNAHYFRMMWSAYGALRHERCVEICDKGTELAYRIGTLPVQYPTIKGMALLHLGRLGEAWQALDDEIADEEHRFGAALQGMGRMQYELNVGAFDEALQRAPWVVAEAKALNRAWMLRWIANAYAAITPEFADLPRIEQVIESTGTSPNTMGRALIDFAYGDVEGAVERLLARLRRVDVPLEVRFKLQAHTHLARAYAELGNWADARVSADAALAIIQEHGQLPARWRMLALRARIDKALGDEQAEQEALVQAEQLWQQVADTIPDKEHRRAYTALAERYGI